MEHAIQVGLERSLAREQIGQVPSCTVGMSRSAAGCWDSTIAVDWVGAEAVAELVTGAEGEACKEVGSTSRSSCSLSVSEST